MAGSLTVKGNPHLLVAGLPGMGKTTCLLNLCKQMRTNGICPIVFSYHQDIDERLEQLVESVRFIDFHGLGFNPLQVKDRGSRMAYLDVAGTLRDIFATIFPEIGDIQAERIRKAIKVRFVETGWDEPDAALANLKEPDFKRFLQLLRDDPKPDRIFRGHSLADWKNLRITVSSISVSRGRASGTVTSQSSCNWSAPRTTTCKKHSHRLSSTGSTRICSVEGSKTALLMPYYLMKRIVLRASPSFLLWQRNAGNMGSRSWSLHRERETSTFLSFLQLPITLCCV